MNKSILHKKTSLHLFVLILPFLTIGCFDNLGWCAPDYEELQSRIYVVNLNGELSTVEQEWIKYGHGSLEYYGIDNHQNYLYYTDSYISSPEEIVRLNYINGSKNTFVLDEKGERFTLSPSGNFFAYEKTLLNHRSDINIFSLLDSSSTLVPRDSAILYNSSPKWISENEITYNGYNRNGNELGIFKVNLLNSTIEQLTNLNGSWGYDLSMDGENVVLSARIKGVERGDEISIFIKKKEDEAPFFVAKGTYPKILPFKGKFIFESPDGIWLSDFDGNTELLYSDRFSYSNKGNLTVSPDGSSIVISNHDGIFRVDIESKEMTQLTSMNDFVSDYGHWESINSSFNDPVFSPDGTKIFFVVTLRYFDDGC